MASRRSNGTQAAGRPDAAVNGHQQALVSLVPALSDARRIGSLSEQARCLFVIGTIADYLSDAEGAIENLDVALSIYRQLDNIAGLAETSTVLGYAYLYLAGDYERGPQLVDKSLHLFRQLGDPCNTAAALADVLSDSTSGESACIVLSMNWWMSDRSLVYNS